MIKDVTSIEAECLRRLNLARMEVLIVAPYTATLLYKLVPRMLPGLGTIGVSAEGLLMVDPATVVNDPELGALVDGRPMCLAGAIEHECEHLWRAYDRFKDLCDLDGELANIAADLPINYDLRSAGRVLPSWGVFPDTLKLPVGKTMEKYFELLLKDPAAYKSTNAQNVKEKKRANGSGTADDTPTPDVCAGRCGSAAGNSKDRQGELDAASECSESSGAEELAVASEQVRTDAATHFSKQAGTTPGWLKDAIEAAKRRPPHNWRRELQNVVRSKSGHIISGGSEFTRRRLSRRAVSDTFQRMGMVDQTLEVAVALDTSGSMSNATLADAKRIVHDVYKELGIDDVWYGQCDTKMTQPFKRMPLKTLLAAPVVGRGGTDFRPIFAAAAKLSPKPDVLLVLTDGYGPAPARPIRGIATVWVLVPTDASTCPAGWGHTVVCTEDHKIRKQLAHK